MLSKKFMITAVACAVSLVAVTSLLAIQGNILSNDALAGDDYHVLTFSNDDLAKFKPDIEGDYRLHPVTFGGDSDYSFRIPLGNGKYINGLLLYGDCGNQTITDLGDFTTARHSGGASQEWFNYSIVLGCKGMRSARMDVTLTFENGYEKCGVILNIVTSTTVLWDGLIEDGHSETALPPQITRNRESYYDYLYGYDSSGGGDQLKSKTLNKDTGDCWHNGRPNGNAVQFRINGFMGDAFAENSVSVRINSLTITFDC